MYPNKMDSTYGIFVHEQVKELVKQGCKVKIISPIPWTPFPIKYLSKKWKRYSEIPSEEIWEGIEVYHPRYLSFPRNFLLSISGWLCYYGIKALIAQIYENFKFDLIHAHTIMPDGCAANKISQVFGKPCVCTIHGSDINIYPEQNMKVKRNIIATLKTIDKLITVSNNLKFKAINLVGNQIPIKVIPNGVDTKIFNIGERTKARQKLGLKLEGKIVLFVGHLIRIKGVNILVDALSILKDKEQVLAIIIGQGEMKSLIQQQIVEYGLNDKVILVGQIPYHEVPLWMNASDVLVLPSHYEGFPCVLLEALACGIPVVGSSVGGIPEVIKSKQYGILVPPRNPESLAEAIITGLNKIWNRNLLRRYAEENSWAKNTQKTIEVYNEIVGEV